MTVRWYAALAVAFMPLSTAAHATGAREPPRVEMRVVGEAAVVFRHGTDACDSQDIPDTPARAFRDEVGVVTLFATHSRNRRLRGPDLLSVRPDCSMVFQGSADPRPERFDDRLWIASTWTADGVTVFALIHSEYQGHHHPGQCPTGRYMDCWYNVVSQAESRDGGRSFRFGRTPPPLVAAVPYRYDPDARRHIGFFTPTNVVRHDGAWFVMVFTEGVGEQRRGTCLLRTSRLADPAAWRAWGGSGFDVGFADPYAADLRPGEHVCEPIARGALHSPVTSLSRHEPSGAFIALMMGERRESPDGPPRRFVFAAASWDLLRWSPPVVVREVAPPLSSGCPGEPPLVDPALLDPASTDRNFETVGATAMVFMTRLNLNGCRHSLDRDLVGLPATIEVHPN
jgi:hypothetical protein